MAEEKKDKEEKKGGGMMKIILIVVVLALVGGALFGGIMIGKSKAPAAAETAAEPTEEDAIVEDATGHGEAKPAEGGHGAAPAAGGHGEAASAHGGGEAAAGAATEEEPVDLIYKFNKNFTTNLMDGNGRQFVQATIQLEAANEAALKEIASNDAPLRDAILMLLGSKESSEILSPAGKERLKRELLHRMDGALSPGAVKNIYITDMMVVRQ